jgi:peptidase E
MDHGEPDTEYSRWAVAAKMGGKNPKAKKRENPVIADWVHVSGGSTEGLLGGWLAQRQAALREVMAAGALSTFYIGSSVRADDL